MQRKCTADSWLAGHLLERLLTSQTNVKLLAHPFSASRGKQVPWLLRDNYADGMDPEELGEYEEGMLKEVGAWEHALGESVETVSVIVLPVICVTH
jgi:hypothetical protein